MSITYNSFTAILVGLLEEKIMGERVTEIATAHPAGQLAIWAAMITIYLVWGSTYLAIRFAMETISPFYMASARFLIAGSILFVFR
jgi:hypothetical protein